MLKIAGMTYTRLPTEGETIRCRIRECGNYIAAIVESGGEIIAFDNIPVPAKPCREDAARNRRHTLVADARAHWRKNGFAVE